MTDHTPGPWIWKMDGDGVATIYAGSSPDQYQIAAFWRREMRDGSFAPQEEQHASAALCAAAPAMHAALRLALPVMRCRVAEFIECAMRKSDPMTVSPSEWNEICADIEAIVAAEACVGRVTDPSWLDAIIDGEKWRDNE